MKKPFTTKEVEAVHEAVTTFIEMGETNAKLANKLISFMDKVYNMQGWATPEKDKEK